MRKIKCLQCGHTWVSGANSLSAKGLYCRKCKGKSFAWAEEEIKEEVKPAFLTQEFIIGTSKDLKDIPESITKKKEAEEKETEATEDKTEEEGFEKSEDILEVSEFEKIITDIKKHGDIATVDMSHVIDIFLELFETSANKQFEKDNYPFRYDDLKFRKRYAVLICDVFGIKGKMSKKKALALMTIIYTRHYAIYKVTYSPLFRTIRVRLVKIIMKVSTVFKKRKKDKTDEKGVSRTKSATRKQPKGTETVRAANRETIN